ncbi:ATP-binding protein [Hydrogenophaga sp. ZJX-1]|uniref:ATP-binding protein n=1 Tax=Hydrogenophaga sp. ZJX-1 TaxID=3404778 RepID=UPI003B285093
MKLQHKAWALVLIVVGLCASSAMLGARYFVGDSFRQLEADRAAREGERARRVLNQQVQALAATARDYAYWVDTVDYVGGRKPAYMSENFDLDNMGYLRISEVLIFDGAGRSVATVARTGGEELARVAPGRVAALRELAHPILAGTDAKAALQTMRVQEGRLEFVIAVAIHHPDRPQQGPSGAMVMVRHFDEGELAQFADVLMTPVRLALGKPEHAGEDIHLVPVDDAHDELHAALHDHQGRTVAELVLSLDRRLQQQGHVLTWQGMGLAALAGLLASALLVLLLDRLMVQRLLRLHAELKGITEQGPSASGQVRVQGNDELAQLANGVNGLLLRVRQDAEAQRSAHERQEALQIQLMQSQKTEALGRLTGGIAHDFNNSLAAITGWVRLAVEDLPDTRHPSHEALQQALKATRYADGLMRQLLAFGRQTPPKLRRLHWTNLIEETRQMVGSGLTRDCELVVDYRVDDDEVDADPTQLQQVLVNLLINAADAMQGKGRIELTLDALELPLPPAQDVPPGAAGLVPGHYLVLTVRDHGAGVAPEHLDRVFEPFFTTKAKGRGTGLGLSVAQGIVVRHHGGLGLRNEPDGGACFHLYLPASRRDAAVDPVTVPGGGTGLGRQLLFVDDDQLVRHAWSALLERKGWNVTRSRDGEEGWAQFVQTGKRWDVVLTDQSMPRLDGVGLAQRIRATNSPPPIVLMSGHVNEIAPELVSSLFAAVLHKPVDAAELQRVLQDVLAGVGATPAAD